MGLRGADFLLVNERNLQTSAGRELLEIRSLAWATGPFGEIAQTLRGTAELRPIGAGDVFTAAICAELARAGEPGEGHAELWQRALGRGHAAVMARGQRR